MDKHERRGCMGFPEDEDNGFPRIINLVVQGLILAWVAIVASMGTLWLVGKFYE